MRQGSDAEGETEEGGSKEVEVTIEFGVDPGGRGLGVGTGTVEPSGSKYQLEVRKGRQKK